MQQAGNSVDMGTCKPWFGCATCSTRTNASKTNEPSAGSTDCIQVLSNSQWDCIKILPSGHNKIAQQRSSFIGSIIWYFLESMNNWFILPQMLIRINTILNTCMTAAHDYLSKKLLPHYSTCLSNKVPNWTCPKPMRRDAWGMWGVEEKASKKICHMHLSK